MIDSESAADLFDALANRPARQLEVDLENFARMGIEPEPGCPVRDAGTHLQEGPRLERLRAAAEFSLAALMQHSLDDLERRIVRLGAELISRVERWELLMLLWKLRPQVVDDSIERDLSLRCCSNEVF